MLTHLNRTLSEILPRDLILELCDQFNAKALAAHQLTQNFGLDERRAKELEGQARFRLLEKMFEEVCDEFGGIPLLNGVIPNTDRRVYQPFRRFEGPSGGVILGLAMMPMPGELPPKNFSREAAVFLNYELTPRLDFEGAGPKKGDLFVLLLAARDRRKAGKIEEIALGLIDSKYESFPFYKTVEEFMVEYAPAAPMPDHTDGSVSVVKLKKGPKKFSPPESTPDTSDDKAG